ncbi:MAG TPA: penicillin-binding protein 1C, partial [Bacteroidota bacterium]|nr:penicillin-binding protein 1C [Bacteroidota bacterium]
MYGVIAIALCVAFVASLFIPLDRGIFRRDELQSMTITDYRGVLLRQTLNDEQGRAHWMPLTHIAPEMLQATIAIEDKRFYSHPGIDLAAILRAAFTNARAGAVVSGGSTLTQQLVKTLEPAKKRSFASKLDEAWRALRLERMMAKDSILEQYVNRVSYGGNVRGVESAAWRYFHKHAHDVSLAEAAFLAALPNAPGMLDPYAHPEKAKARQKRVLECMRDQGMISQQDFERACAQLIEIAALQSTSRAPHVCDMVVRQYQSLNAAAVTTTIDEALQEVLTRVVTQHLKRLTKRHVTQASVIVIDNQTGEIRALIGSSDYFNVAAQGQVNGACALRQPGSAIKPLMYALSFDLGRTPAEIIPDIPTAIPDVRGDYVPENYDRMFHGPVSIRTALACSYNVPAVRVLESVGKDVFLQKLRACGLTSLTATAEYYGYGLTLGNAEVTLMELANAYRALSMKGVWTPCVLVRKAITADGVNVTMPDARPAVRVYSDESAFLVSDILSDATARTPAFGAAFRFPFACAVKTGTTKDYKDNWTLGYTTRYTLGVWAGNFDGSPMHGVSGVTGAGQIFTDLMTILHSPPYGIPPGPFQVPAGLERKTICPRSGCRPGDACPHTTTEWFVRGAVAASSSPDAACTVHRRYRVRDARGVEIERVYERYGSEYALWQQSMGLPAPPADAVSLEKTHALHAPALQTTHGERRARVLISSPNDGDSFKI